MIKLFAVALTASLFGGSAAQAACGGSCCAQAAPCCTSGAPAAPADEHSNMNMPSAKAPQATRSFSYQPGASYGATRAMNRQGWNSGARGATSKALGNY